MGIWDKGKTLNAGEILTEAYAPDEAFALFGMASAGEVDLENGFPPANKTVMLCQRVESVKGGLTLVDEPKIVGTFSTPIGNMAAESDEGDFPVVVCYRKVVTKADREATVLDLIQDQGVPDVDPEKIPREWAMYAR